MACGTLIRGKFLSLAVVGCALSLSSCRGVDTAGLEPLLDRKAWIATSPQTRAGIAKKVARRLGDAYELLGLKSFKLAANGHELAVYRHKESGLELCLIPGGRYTMGSGRGFEDERPPHEVTLMPFFIGRAPVNQASWDRIGGSDKRNWRGPGLPIEGVSHKDVSAWLKKAGGELRLPSEAEWEYAARGGATGERLWSESLGAAACWSRENAGSKTRELAAHAQQTNGFGLVDVLGQVWEWCQDDWIADYRSGPNDATPRRAEGATECVARGACILSDAKDLRVAIREKFRVESRDAGLGFRVSRSLP